MLFCVVFNVLVVNLEIKIVVNLEIKKVDRNVELKTFDKRYDILFK